MEIQGTGRIIPPKGDYLLDSDGLWAINYSLKKVAGLDELIRDAAVNNLYRISNLVKIIDHPCSLKAPIDVNMLLWGNGNWLLGMEFSSLQFRTEYRVYKDDDKKEAEKEWIAPCFSKVAGSFPAEYYYTLPDTIKFLAVLLVDNNHGNKAFLALHDQIKHKLFLPPFGNVYEDGTMCTGRNALVPAGLSKGEIASNLLDLFCSSPWNADLIKQYTLETCPNLIRFSSKEDGECLLPKKAGLDNLRSASNTILVKYYENFFGESKSVSI